MKPPQSQFTILELMGLVALSAIGFALPTIWLIFLGVGALLVVPGYVVERARGGTGIVGGILSGCLIPMGLAWLWAAVEYVFANRPIRDTLDFLPALFGLFVFCLVWSSLTSFVLFLADGRLRARPRSYRRSTGAIDAGIRFLSDQDGPAAGIRFLPDEDGPGNVPRTKYVPVSRVPATRRRPER